jgi:hypothetical protein
VYAEHEKMSGAGKVAAIIISEYYVAEIILHHITSSQWNAPEQNAQTELKIQFEHNR